MRRALTFVGVVLAMSFISACGDGKSDSRIDREDTGPASVMRYPDGFRNVAHKCDGYGHRVYSTSRGRGDGDSTAVGSGVAVINDSNCPGGSGQ